VKKQSKFSLVCDVIFELALILVVLLAALLVSRNDVIAPAGGYHVNIISLAATIGLVVFYLAFMVCLSLKGEKKDEEALGHDQ